MYSMEGRRNFLLLGMVLLRYAKTSFDICRGYSKSHICNQCQSWYSAFNLLVLSIAIDGAHGISGEAYLTLWKLFLNRLRNL